jgi:hypothetical protein
MGCSTDINDVLLLLKEVGADKQEGQFLIGGPPPIMFMGIGPDCVLQDGISYFLNGERRNLIDLIVEHHKGVRVHVIGE